MPEHSTDYDPAQAEWILSGFEKKLEKLFRAALKEVIALLPKPEVKTQAWEGLSLAMDEVDGIFAGVYKLGEKIVTQETEKAYRQGWLYGGIQLGAPPEVRKEVWSKVGARVIKSQSDFKRITDVTAGQIRSIIAEGMIEEKSYGTIVDELTRTVDSVGINRARTMVRSETMRAVNDGVKDRYTSDRVTLFKRLEALDERTCTDWTFSVGGKIYNGCAGIDGEIFTREQADSIDAQTHPNCRGTWTPYVEIPKGAEDVPEEVEDGDGHRVIDPFNSSTFRHLLEDENYGRGRSSYRGDEFLRDLCKERGCDKLPVLISKAEMDQLEKNGARILYRGVGHAEYVDEFKFGEFFAGKGIFGNGTYTAYGEDGLSLAKSYAGSNGGILRMTLDPKARVISLEDLEKEREAYVNALYEWEGDAPLNEKRLRSILGVVLNDPGRFGTIMGYDAILVERDQFMVILSRNVVKVQKEVVI